MVRQGRWKSWALVLAFGLCALEALVALRLVSRPPDVVLVAPDGQGTYLNPSVAGQALLRFLREQRQLPSDVTVLHFTREFARRFFALDAATAETSFQEALAMMTPGLRGPIAQEAAETKLLEGIRASRTRVALTFEAVDLLEQTESAVRVRLVLRRRTETLDDGKPPLRGPARGRPPGVDRPADARPSGRAGRRSAHQPRAGSGRGSKTASEPAPCTVATRALLVALGARAAAPKPWPTLLRSGRSSGERSPSPTRASRTCPSSTSPRACRRP